MHYAGPNPYMPDSISTYSYNFDQMSWEKDGVIELNYNAAGLVSSGMMYGYQDGLRYPFMRMNLFYDAQNRLIHGYYDVNIDMGGRSWLSFARYHFNYGNGVINSLTLWMTDWSEETGYSHSQLTNDAQGRPIEEVSQTSADSTNWAYDSRYVTTYTAWDTSSGLDMIGYISQYFPIVMMGYYPDAAMGAVQHDSYYEWNGAAWDEIERYDFSYNAQYQCTEEVGTINGGGGWVNDSRWLNSYDSQYGGKLSSRVEQDWFGGTWENYEKQNYSYLWVNVASDDPSVPPAGSVRLSLYPSPFTDKVSIALKSESALQRTVQVFNLKGQVLRQWRVSGNAIVVWDGRDAAGDSVPSGVYLIKAGDGAGSVTRKCLKLK